MNRRDPGPCHPMHPVDFSRMTPAQRKALAARRSLQVERAAEQHTAGESTAAEREAAATALRSAVATLAFALDVHPLTTADQCIVCGCRRAVEVQGKCNRHYRAALSERPAA